MADTLESIPCLYDRSAQDSERDGIPVCTLPSRPDNKFVGNVFRACAQVYDRSAQDNEREGITVCYNMLQQGVPTAADMDDVDVKFRHVVEMAVRARHAHMGSRHIHVPDVGCTGTATKHCILSRQPALVSVVSAPCYGRCGCEIPPCGGDGGTCAARAGLYNHAGTGVVDTCLCAIC